MRGKPRGTSSFAFLRGERRGYPSPTSERLKRRKTSCRILEKNYDLLQDNVMEKKTLLYPGRNIEISSTIISVDLFSNDEESLLESEIKSEWIHCKDHLITIDHLLHVDECREIVNKQHVTPFESIDSEYPIEYRNSQRIVFNDKKLAQRLWNRLEKHLVNDCNYMKPYGLDTEGRWIPIGINECMRLSRYEKGNYFKPHTDGQFARNDDERSVYTLLIYLNDGFVGGETKFLQNVIQNDEDLHQDDDNDEDREMKFKHLCTINPRMGCAALFNHEVYHEGSMVTEGVKYILRTEVMFKRIHTPTILSLQGERKQEDDSTLHHTVMELLRKSDEYEALEDVTQSTLYYRKAQQLLIKNGHSTSLLMVPKFNRSLLQTTNGYPEDYPLKSPISKLPDEILIHIFNYLQDWEICTLILPLDSYFNYVGRSQQLWESMYMRKWGHSITNLLKQFHSKTSLELYKSNSIDNTSSLENTPTEIQDWFHIYISKRYFEKEFEPVCIDFGLTNDANTYFSTIADDDIQRSPTKVYRHTAAHHSIVKFSSYTLERTGCSTITVSINDSFDSDCGPNDNIQVFTSLLYKKMKKSCQRNPLIVSLGSALMRDFQMGQDLMKYFMFRIRIPALCILPRCYLLSLHYNLPNCLVVDVESNAIYAHAIFQHNKDEITTVHDGDWNIDENNLHFKLFESCKSAEEKSECFGNCKIVKLIEMLLEEFSQEERSQLLNNIIFSGNIFENPDYSHRGELIRKMFDSPQSTYRVQYQTYGEEAIMAAQSFSKLPNFKDYCCYWSDCDLNEVVDPSKHFIL